MNQMTIIAVAVVATMAHVMGARVVDRYTVNFATPGDPNGNSHGIPMGTPQPPGGPYAGNGDVNVMYVGNASSHTNGVNGRPGPTALGWAQALWLSKNDMWGSDAQDYYPHLSAGRVRIQFATPPGASASANGTVVMVPGNATLESRLVDAAGSKASLTTTTRVLENNAVTTSIVCTSASGAACDVTLVVSDTNNNYYKVDQAVGAASDGTSVWWRKENFHNALNPAYLGPCDSHIPLQSTERLFAIDTSSGSIQLGNGSCLWSDATVSSPIVTSGACSDANGKWTWKGSATSGDIVHTASSKCLTSSLSLGPCGSTPWATIPGNDTDTSLVYISGGGGCVVVVPDNNNNTLGVAVGVADATGSLVKGKTAPVSATDASAGISLSVSLTSGAEYTLVIGLQTLRDVGCAGIRPQWESCTTSPQAAATALVQSMASTSARAAAVQTSEAFWSNFWAASSIDLTNTATPNASLPVAIVERWYYLSQYLLGCTTRDGKVTPALDGFVCVEPVAWGDQFTLDYNLEATFWGAGSSNRIDFIHPVMASTTNPGAIATARLRAQNPGTWGYNAPWHSVVGHTQSGATCMPDGCPNLTSTGFKGAEWPSAGMPLGDNRLADNDLQTRFIGGLLATNLIQYWEYSHNMTTLADKIYPFVKDNAEFYLSYATKGSDGKLVFPYTCAQEGCACRDAGFVKIPNVPVPNTTTACKDPKSPMLDRCPGASGWMLNHPCYECYPYIATGSSQGNHNAHPDVAFASSTFRNAVRFAKLLGVDSDMATAWQAALDSMPDYPTADFTFIDGVPGSEYNGGAGFLVEAEYGYEPGVYPNGTSASPATWPWCNKEYPIANFAAMWPTDEIGATQTNDTALLAKAKQTVYALNKYQGKPWANTNGFCLSWPPAVRVSGQEDAETLVTSFATAIGSATGNNGCVHNHGGMLENIGATVAVNDLLLQSHGGRMRFFPAWKATVLGPASFTTLRAYGAFLVSASVDAQGTVSPIALTSEVGGDVVFESPWGTATPKVTDSKGNNVATTQVSIGVFSFPTDAAGTYTITGSK
eukprot:m.39036 g.39036  ORF g.39036 m.39036 type:complete len:1049 (+) comp5747_c0_seq1:158-3304(+)